MYYTDTYNSPLGDILLRADDTGITGLWFAGVKNIPSDLEMHSAACVYLDTARYWLDIYFSGREPAFTVPLHYTGTAFQHRVWDILCTIPYGQTLSYGQIAAQLSPRMSAQAVGNAVGRNPVSILVPCHRVIGADGSLTGYAGGIERKEALLQLEKQQNSKYFP